MVYCCPATPVGTGSICLFVFYAKHEHGISLVVLMPCSRASALCVFQLSTALVTQATAEEKQLSGSDNFISLYSNSPERNRCVFLCVNTGGGQTIERGEL